MGVHIGGPFWGFIMGVPNRGPKSGSQIGVPNWGLKLGSQIGVPYRGPKLGSHIGFQVIPKALPIEHKNVGGHNCLQSNSITYILQMQV
jgi:hypothetical protein